MTDGRQETRNMGKEVETSHGRFVAPPLPWRKRNDLGNAINKSYLDSINNALKSVKVGEGEGDVEFQGGFREALFDWDTCLNLAFPVYQGDLSALDELSIEDIRALLCASCDVNGLEVLKHMIDPNFPNPQAQTGEQAGPTDGQKTTSTEDSGLSVVTAQ